MIRSSHQIPSLAGTCYALAGAYSGLSVWRGDWIDVLTLALAIMTGLWAGAASRCAPTPRLRRPLLAFSILAPVTLIPEVFQPVQELTALRLLTAATILDALATASNGDDRESTLRRWLWPALTYGGSIVLAFRNASLDGVAAIWGGSCLLVVIVTSIARLRKPRDLNQEASAHHIIWTLVTSVIAAFIVSVIVDGRQDVVWVVSVAMVGQGLSVLTANLSRDETSFSARASLAPPLVAALISINAYIILLNVAHPGPSGAAAAVLFASLLSGPMTLLTRDILNVIPPRSNVDLERAISEFAPMVDSADDVEELVAALRPLGSALPRPFLGVGSRSPASMKTGSWCSPMKGS